MLKVTMHWYWFQTFTWRLSFSSSVRMVKRLSSACQ